jgi:hypothetical protein
MTDIQNLMKFPYGVSFNCYFFIYNTWIAINDPLTDGVISPDEALALSIVLVNDILTNILFNLGYMYNDVLQTLTLPATTQNFWQRQAMYWGDFFIRFFYRRSFLANFSY